MREIEQLRTELNELRERVALLENRPPPIDLMRFGPRQMPQPGVIMSDESKAAVIDAIKRAAVFPGTRVRCAITGQDLGSAD